MRIPTLPTEPQETSSLGEIVDQVDRAAEAIMSHLNDEPREWSIGELQEAAGEETGASPTIVSIAFNHLLQGRKLTVGADLKVRLISLER